MNSSEAKNGCANIDGSIVLGERDDFMNAKSMKYFKFCLWYVARKDRETR